MNITPLRYTYTCLGAVALCDNLQDSKLRPLIKTHLFANSALSVLQKVTPVKMKVVKTKIILKHTFSLSPCAKKGPEKSKSSSHLFQRICWSPKPRLNILALGSVHRRHPRPRLCWLRPFLRGVQCCSCRTPGTISFTDKRSTFCDDEFSF